MTAYGLSVIVPVSRASRLTRSRLDRLWAVLAAMDVRYEVLLVGAEARLAAVRACPESNERAVCLPGDDQGAVWQAGIAVANGEYCLMVGDIVRAAVPSPDTLRRLWAARETADVLVASSPTVASPLRRLVRALQRAALGLAGVSDYYEPLHLCRLASVAALRIEATGAEALPEVLVRAHAEGLRILAVPLADRAGIGSAGPPTLGDAGRSIRHLWRLWRLRTSIQSADYDDRAFDSPIPLQRYWQRTRFRHITELSCDAGRVLDVGCGSSRIIGALPPGSVALDILVRKLRHARRFGRALVQGSAFHLPFADEAFPCVVCSQVIEHVPMDSGILEELCRVLAPGGRLVLGTPDYARWEWVWMERLYAVAAPGGYAEEHITHYTHRDLVRWFGARGFTVEATRYILRGELILALRKPGGRADIQSA